MQMHVNIAFPEISQVTDAFTQVTDNGYKLHLSEVDISVNPFHKNITLTHSQLISQATFLKAIVLNYDKILPQYQYGITFWGISDKNSWLQDFYKQKDAPLLFDDYYASKPAYCSLKE